MASVQLMWDKIIPALEATNENLKTMNNQHVMATTPSSIRKAYFNKLYKTIAGMSELYAVEMENTGKLVELQKQELDIKVRSVQLQELLLGAVEKWKTKKRRSLNFL